QTQWPFVDADELHPAANIAKMRSGTALTDEDRIPWLRRVAARAVELQAPGTGLIVGCSALKRSYRDLLRESLPQLRPICLRGTRADRVARLRTRHGHFSPPSLLDAQLADLQPPSPDENALEVSIETPPAQIVDEVLAAIGR